MVDEETSRCSHPRPLKFTLVGGAGFDLLMLPHPILVNREDETYVLIGPGNLQVRVTKENWNTLWFNTKTWNPEYFPDSYLRPVPTITSGDGDVSTAKFPRPPSTEPL
jgi:hypothetical protein